MSIVVREYQPEDGPALNAVAQRAFLQYRDKYTDWESFFAGIGRMADLAQTGRVVVAVKDGTLVGGVVYVPPGAPRSPVFPADWAVIRMLVVPPEQRGQGIGARLTERCLDLARADGAPAVGLHTSVIMEAALHLYLRLGFVKDRDLPDIHGVPYGRYVLRIDGAETGA